VADAPKTLRDGRYAIVRLLGEGGQATTFEAVDKRDGKLVAVKRFVVRGAKSWKEVELAEREARVLASIAHPSLPRHVEHFEEGGELYLVTEKIEGESLAERKRRGARLDEAEVVRLLSDASTVLDYLHGRAPPLIHRDLKPSNVIRRPDGSFAFIDFGSVRDRLKPEGGSTVVGTFGYMAPEQFQGRAMPGSDVYAIGATAMALLTGREPEELPHRGLAIDVPAALAGARVGRELARALARMLDPDPDTRPSRLAPLLDELRGARGGRGREAHAEEPRRSAHESRREAREAFREARRERRERRREERFRKGAPDFARVPPILVALAILGMSIAQLVLILVLRVKVPIVLTVLSVVFGKGLRNAAREVAEAGRSVGEAIERAKTMLRDGARGEARRQRVAVPAEAPPERVRVADPGAYDEAELAAEEEARAEEEALKTERQQ
jgi:hypothetical protein